MSRKLLFVDGMSPQKV